MPNKMLIDASHPEETRVVVLRGNRVEEFDFESANKKQLRGNIYLAKVTRVEPSLQAAFVEYGGNRHGFLAFSEIHPDYYQIPVADRLALLEEEARTHRDEEEEDGRPPRRNRRHRRSGRAESAERRAASPDEAIGQEIDEASPDMGPGGFDERPSEPESGSEELVSDDVPPRPIGEVAAIEQRAQFDSNDERQSSDADAQTDAGADARSDAEAQDVDASRDEGEHARTRASEVSGSEDEESEEDAEEDEEYHVEQIGGDALEEMPARAPRLRRQYKIQEVIKRRQVLLVQVVKEERGNKGAALTTYLSLAGRYSVLMPNTARGGGISRKITDSEDRKRLKSIVQELDVPYGMGVILRTAGASRTKPEVRRDFEYLLRMWETVRELTLKSSAPTLVYEEGSLIKRAIRDLYNKDIEEILIAGEQGFEEAREFMRMLMPSQVKSVIFYRDPQPLFARHGVEAQLDSMFSNQVTLRSGGYLVINQAEALVAIDVNSGRSTREHNIEDTALRTNLEAADEVARQLRLRDLAGLIVVDFIDMEEHRNNRSVERRLKEALKNDRARIQVGRISHFGLLEMSRQRIRTGVLEGSTVICPHCLGAGTVRSTSSIALHVLRVLEDALIKSAAFNISVRTRTAVALYILNQKRVHLRELEERFGVVVTISADDSMTGAVYHAIERGEPAVSTQRTDKRPEMVRVDSIAPVEFEEESEGAEGEAEEDAEASAVPAETGLEEDAEAQRRRRRRRRRRGRGADREGSGIGAEAPQPSDEALAVMAQMGGVLPGAGLFSDGEVDDREVEAESAAADFGEGERVDERPRRRRARRGRSRPDEASAQNPGLHLEFPDAPRPEESGADESTEAAKPAETPSQAPAATSEPEYAPARSHASAHAPAEPERSELPEAEPPQEKRSGWWQRAKASFGGN